MNTLLNSESEEKLQALIKSLDQQGLFYDLWISKYELDTKMYERYISERC